MSGHGEEGEIPSPSRVLRSAVFPAPHSARIIDAVLMGLLVYRLPAPLVPIDVPLAQLAVIALVAISLFRRPTRSLAGVAWFPILCVVLLVFVTTVSLLNDLDVTRRAGNVTLLMVMAGFLASGRIDVSSALKGVGVALALNAALFVGGIAPDSYQGALTGYLQDKNVAGLVYGVAALLVSAITRRTWPRVVILVAGGLAVVATESRTSMAAFVCGVIWLAVAPRLALVFRALIGLGIFLLFLWAQANLATIGVYRTERAGSDALRERIHQASLEKLALTPWTGGGFGQATADVDGTAWFFHNSYLALIVEGGAVLLIGVLLIYVLAGFGLLASSDGYGPHAVGGATVIVLLCATQLGEVFFAPISFVVVGVGLALVAERPRGTKPAHRLPLAERLAR